MTPLISITLDDKKLEVKPGRTIMEACKEADVNLPALCDFKGLGAVGACRLCLVEVEGIPRLLPACTTLVAENQIIHTNSPRLQKHRRVIIELFFSERNHICSVCVANNHCELQDMGYQLGMEHVRFPYLNQDCHVDASHKKFVMDHNRCILCGRCVRVCDEIEGAHTWDFMGRGFKSRVISDFNQPWGESVSCTWCTKCVNVCPTGALWSNEAAQGTYNKFPESISGLAEKRGVKK